MSRRQDMMLKYIAIFFWLLSLGNAYDFFFAIPNDFRKIKGKVTNVSFRSFFGRTSRTLRTYYTKTIINVEGRNKDFFVIDNTDRDSLLLRIQKGDEIELYGRKWYHYLSYFGLEANMFLVKRNGKIIYDITDNCKRSNKVFIIVCGIIGLTFTMMYLDQVKNISLENWFQKRFGKKKDDDWIEVR